MPTPEPMTGNIQMLYGLHMPPGPLLMTISPPVLLRRDEMTGLAYFRRWYQPTGGWMQRRRGQRIMEPWEGQGPAVSANRASYLVSLNAQKAKHANGLLITPETKIVTLMIFLLVQISAIISIKNPYIIGPDNMLGNKGSAWTQLVSATA